MSIIVVGVNHRSAPLAVLERLAIAPDEQAKAVTGLVQRDNIREVADATAAIRGRIDMLVNNAGVNIRQDAFDVAGDRCSRGPAGSCRARNVMDLVAADVPAEVRRPSQSSTERMT